MSPCSIPSIHAFVHVGPPLQPRRPPLWEPWTCARSAGTLLSFVYLCLSPPPRTLESKEGFSCLERYLMDIYAAVGQRGEPLISFTDTFPWESTSQASVHTPQPNVFSCPSSSAQARPGGSFPVTPGGDGGEVMVKINPQTGCAGCARSPRHMAPAHQMTRAGTKRSSVEPPLCCRSRSKQIKAAQ